MAVYVPATSGSKAAFSADGSSRCALLPGGSRVSTQWYFSVCLWFPRTAWQVASLSLSSTAGVRSTGVATLMLAGRAPMELICGTLEPQSSAVMVRRRGTLTKYWFFTTNATT